MARKARGSDILEVAKAYLEKTAEAIGVSPGWACQLRNRFIKVGKVFEADKPPRGGRRRENMTIEEEKEFLLPFFEKAKSGGILVVNNIKDAMDRRLGRQVALASAYNLLHRHGWRKLAPDKRHPQSDVERQEAWKKNSPTPLPKSPKHGRGKDQSD